MNSSADHGATRLNVEIVRSENAAWIIIQGEADIANLEQLEADLTSIELNGQKAVHIDVSDLDFLDVAALHQLTVFATQVTQSGLAVTTRGAQPLVHEVVQILGVRDTLGLT